MKNLLQSLMLVLMCALLLNSCANDDVTGVEPVDNYLSAFEKVFGKVNPSQNFNTQKTLNIESSFSGVKGNYTLKVYDGDPTTTGASLLGKFEKLNSGSASVKVGVSKGVSDIFCVADDGDKSRMFSCPVPESGPVKAKFDEARIVKYEETATPNSVTVAYEDLGSTYDWDFNDAVIKVEYVTGTGTATVTLMAVAAKKALHLNYSDATGANVPLFDGKELHEAMGYSQEVSINGHNVNQSPGVEKNGVVVGVEFQTCEISVPEDFYIGEDGVPFMLTVDGVEGQVKITGSTEYGATPQVLVLGNYHSDKYSMTFYYVWPVENTSLKEAYPGVERWFSDPSDVSFMVDGFIRPSKVYQGYDPHIPDGGYQVETPEDLEAVDLGLPSGTLWANMNVGATAPEEPGGYYAWGEIEEKDYYDRETYLYYDRDFPYPFTDSRGRGYMDLGEISGKRVYDVATAKWGPEWQMPTYDQIEELFRYASLGVKAVNNMVCFELHSTINGNSILIPAGGFRYRDQLYSYGGFESGSNPPYSYYGAIWSGTMCEPDPADPRSSNLDFNWAFADNLYFSGEYQTGSGFIRTQYNWTRRYRFFGHSVRPVRK